MNDQRRLGLVILLNLVIVIAESAAGVIGGSLSLLSDAWHNLSDVLALVVTAVALRLASRPAGPSMTFGFVRAEMMAGFINAAFLALLMIWVAVEAFQRLLHPVAVDARLTAITAAVALIVNTASAWLLGGHHHDHRHDGEGHEHDASCHDHTDVNMRAAFWHMAGDAALSLAVVIGAGAMMLWGIVWIDPLLSLLFVIVILRASIGLARQSFLSLMDHADPERTAVYGQILRTHPDVIDIHDLHLSVPSSRESFLSAHVILDGSLPLHNVETVLEHLRHDLAHAGATHILLQPETEKYRDSCHNGACDSHIP